MEILAASRRHTSLILCLVILVGSFLVTFSSNGAWRDNQVFADEPAWITNSLIEWHTRTGSSIMFSPLYQDMMAPFLVAFGQEPGFKIWKFLMFLVTPILLFLVLARLTMKWIALWLSLHFQYLVTPYQMGTYTYLPLTFFLISAMLVTSKRANAGAALGVLGLASLVRFELGLYALVFGVLLLLFDRTAIFSRRFWMQLAPFMLLFTVVVYWHGSNLRELPYRARTRGYIGVDAYIMQTMVDNGYFRKYTSAGWGHIPNDIQDRCLMEYFGTDTKGFLDMGIVEKYRKNPKVMREYFQRIRNEGPVLIEQATEVRVPFVKLTRNSIYQLALFLFIAIAPIVVGLVFWRKRTQSWFRSQPPRKQLILLLLASFSGLYAWLMVPPYPHYVIMLAPACYLGLGLLLTQALGAYPRLSAEKVSKSSVPARKRS